MAEKDSIARAVAAGATLYWDGQSGVGRDLGAAGLRRTSCNVRSPRWRTRARPILRVSSNTPPG